MYQLTAEQVMGAPLERLDAYLSCLRSKLTGKDGLQVTVARQANHVLVRVLCVYFVCVCVCVLCACVYCIVCMGVLLAFASSLCPAFPKSTF